MNNESQQQKKDSILKSLAILGFIGVIIMIAWFSIKLVNIAPGAFSSLASLAETLTEQKSSITDDTYKGEQTTITIINGLGLINASEDTTVSWVSAEVPGSYTFSYQCSEGIAIDLKETDTARSITCGTDYNIGNISELTFSVDSEKERYADVQYKISFFGTNDTVPRAIGTAQLTVVNSDISNILDTTPSNEEEQPTPETKEPEVKEPIAETLTPPTPNTPIDVTPNPVPPVYEPEYEYITPISDPNGRVDLAARFLALGRIVNDTFFAGTIKQGEVGAIQFEVLNHGSKTSGTWTYSITLPNGSMYQSKLQAALKPNERAVLTIGFPTVLVDMHNFVVIVDEASDQVTLNDHFQKPVLFLD